LASDIADCTAAAPPALFPQAPALPGMPLQDALRLPAEASRFHAMKTPFADTNALLRDAVARWRRQGLLSPADAGRLLEDIGPDLPWSHWIRALAAICLTCIACAAVGFFCDDAVEQFIRSTGMLERVGFFAALALLLRLGMLKAGKGLGTHALGLLACICAWAAAGFGCLAIDIEAPCWLAAALFCTLTPGPIPAFFALGALAFSLLGTPIPDVCSQEARCAVLGLLASLPALAGRLPRRWLNPSLALLTGSLGVLAADGHLFEGCYAPEICTLAGLAVCAGLFAWGAARLDPVPRRWGLVGMTIMLALEAARHLDYGLPAAGVFALVALASGAAAWFLSRRLRALQTSAESDDADGKAGQAAGGTGTPGDAGTSAGDRTAEEAQTQTGQR